jgi:hypothetical protein
MLNDLYAKEFSENANPATFNFLFMSDIDLDINYVAGESSINCNERSCCHADSPAQGDYDRAPKYGHRNCNMPLEGFKKMIDTIEALK